MEIQRNIADSWINLEPALWHQIPPITSHRSPFAINNVTRSPCLSFNSIFTPCQLHLEPFHHHYSPSAKTPPQDLSSPLMFDERSNNGSLGAGGRCPTCATVVVVVVCVCARVFYLLYFFFLGTSPSIVIWSIILTLPPEGFLPLSGTTAR